MEKNSTAILNKEKISVAIISVLSNTFLMIAKLITGFLIGSVSVISEAIHSGIDLVAAIIAFFAVKHSSEPPDFQHKYGHGKIENISGAIEALLILAAAIWIIIEAVLKIIHGSMVEDVTLGIIVMAVSCIVNFFVSQKLMKTAKKTDSIALEADAWHLRTDVYTSLGILAGLIAIKFTGIKMIDPIMALIVAVLIIKTSIQLVIRSVKDLLDTNLPIAEEEEITKVIKKYSSSHLNYHHMRTRKSGSDRFIDFHMVFPKDMTLEKAHSITDKIEADIKQKYPRASVIIHLEPCDERNKCDECKTECSNLNKK